MDPPQEGFDELERAFEHANFLSLDQPQHESHGHQASKRMSHHLSHSVPTTYADIPSSDSEIDISPISNDDSSEPFDVTITPPPGRQGLSRHNSGLPPTPPTMTNSEIMEPKEDRNASPVPLFADRVRNALENQKSGSSTPVVGNISPPTPGSSPPSTADNLHPPRPKLEHSQSSYAESFQTATEGLGDSRSASRSTSQAQLNAHDGSVAEEDTKTVIAEVTPSPGLPAYRDNWRNQMPEDSDRSEARVRVKNYQMESDSELEKGVTYLASDDKDVSAAEDTPPPAVDRKILNHRTAFQRLRRPLQPGDEFKRPDEALLYSSNLSWKPRKTIRAPKREMSAEFMTNAGLVKVEVPQEQPTKEIAAQAGDLFTEQEMASTTSPAAASPVEATAPLPAVPVQDEPTPEFKLEKEVAVEAPLREFAPSAAPAELPSPPTTAAKQSLEDNNQVYRLIQEENVKRHSAISDGSIQAVVVARAEPPRTLRHTRKRESLRGNVSIASAEPNGIEDIGVKSLRRKRGSTALSPHEVARRAVSDNPAAAMQSTPLRSFSAGPEHVRELRSTEPSQRRISKLPAPFEEEQALTAHTKVRKSPRERYQSGMPSAVANESRRMSSAPNARPRPWSMDLSELPQANASPRLRRFSRDERLENNLAVRRTSLGHFTPLRDQTNRTTPEVQPTTQTSEAHQALQGEIVRDIPRGTQARPQSFSSKEADPPVQLTPTLSVMDGIPLLERRTARNRPMSLELPTSPKRRSLDPRHLHSNGTPFSTSQLSDRTALTEPELCEARGVEIYPHNNRSLLLVQQSAQPAAKRIQPDAVAGAPQPIFKAVVEAPEEEELGRSKHTVDSPLTNPRAAPEPPVIKFIPPTPNEEVERQLEESAVAADNPKDNMQRRPSLKQRMRRFSEGLIEPLPFGRNGSVRKAKQRIQQPDVRPTHLSSNWVPNDIWAQDYSDDEDDEIFEPLPPGGDTSEVVETEKENFPRKMSKRLPGFRGAGGFLQGNSLGIDRHGTNNRRHHINTRTSQEMLNRMTEKSRRRTFTLPFGKGTRVEYVGFAGFGAQMREVRRRRQERALEKRRDQLRRSIGTRLFHEGR